MSLRAAGRTKNDGENDDAPGCESRPLLVEVMRDGEPCMPAPSLPRSGTMRGRALQALPNVCTR